MLGRRARLVAGVVLLALTSAGCAQEADRDPLAGTTRPTTTVPADDEPGAFVPDPIEWDDCGAVDCATLEVPLDYGDPSGARFELYVVRAPARGSRIGALFVNPGGPGASGAEMAELLPLILPSEITDRFDIVGVDPRGVGGSTPLSCGVPLEELYGVDASIDSPEDRDALLEVSEAYVSDCAEQHGDLLPHLGTRDVAHDMDAVRAAMGDDQLSFLGFSYGSMIGQVYADLYPHRVRSMVLDGIVELGPSGLELAATQAAGFETALERFVEYCDAAEGCEIAGRSRQAVEEVLALAEEPGGIPARDADRPAGPGEVSLGIAYALYSQQLWNQLDAALAAALDGDGTGMVGLADAYLTFGAFEVYYAVNCMDFAWPSGDPDAFLAAAEAAGEASPSFGEAIVNDYIRCVDWPVPPDPIEAVTADGAPPIVVISTTGDPATPYEAGVAVAERLANGVLVTFEGEGHTVVANGNRCIDDLLVAYLVDGNPPPDGTTCS